MKRIFTVALLRGAMTCALASCFAASAAAQSRQPVQSAVHAYGRLPLTFERNEGQGGPTADFVSRGSGYTLSLNGNRTVFLLAPMRTNRTDAARNAARSLLSVQLLGADATAYGEGLDEQPGKSNYFVGNDRRHWRTGIANYSKVRYRDVYPGVDLVYYGNRGELEHDFIVAPGADPTRIRMKLDGVAGLQVAPNGDLELRLNTGGPVFLRRPQIYQERGGAKAEVSGRYVVTNKREVRFALANYDHTSPLIIDPVMSYATYLGGTSAVSFARGIAVDASGNAYVTGVTDSVDFPTMPGAVQPTVSKEFNGSNLVTFVTKFNASGTALIYSTFLGGTTAMDPGTGDPVPSSDQGIGIAVDSSGNAYVVGTTDSIDFPTFGAVQTSLAGATDAFVTKLDPAGSTLIYSTYLGGSTQDVGLLIALDSSGRAVVSGTTHGDFPVVAGAYQSAFAPGSCSNCTDVFVAKLDATGSAVVFATYLGGSFIDTVGGMALDSASNVYISGSTALNRSGFVQYPTTPGAFQTTRQGNTDAFVTKLSADGTTLLYSTFLGGTANDAAGGIAVDASGNAYVTGRALSQPGNPSNTFPITPGAFNGTPLVGNNAFVTKLSADGSGLVYSTFLVGSHCESVGQGIQVDASGNAWVTGYAAFDPSTGCDFPTTADGFTQPSPYREFDGSREFFTTKFNADGSALLFSTLGAGGSLSGILSIVGGGITLDAEANVYIAGGWAAPTPGAFQIQNPGEMPYSDAMVIKVADDHIAPTTTATPSGTPGNAGWWKSDVTVGLLAADTPLGLGVKEVTYSAAGSQSIAATTVAGNSASPVISADGQTTVSFFARDNADNVETSHDLVVKVDKQAPSILCGNPDGAWHATDVSLGCTAGDSVSGLANGADASFSLATSLAAGSESATTPTGSRGVCDVAGNCATAGPIGGNKIDKKSPTVSITAPAATTYLLNQVVAASYGCTDGGSGVASCAGTAANGASINTSSVGSKTFTVNGTDTVGNASAPASVAYKITYKVYPMYDSTKAFNAKGNATIKMQLQNAAGANRSAAGVVVTALRVSTPGDAAVVKPLSGNFTFDSTLTYQQSAPGGGYRYSLDPTGLVSGTYALVFSVPGDPVLHLLPLTIK